MNTILDKRASCVEYDPSEEPITIPKQVTDIILAEPKPGDLLALYWFYYQTAKWQGDMRAKCTNSYVARGLDFPLRRVIRGKLRLIELGLVRNICRRDAETKQIIGHFVRVHLVPYDKKATVSKSDIVASRHRNALDPNRLNLNTRVQPFDAGSLPAPLCENKDLLAAWKRFVDYRRKVRRKPISENAWRLSVNKMKGFEPHEIIAALTEAEAGDYQSFFPRKSFTAKSGRTITAASAPPDKAIATQVESLAQLVTDAELAEAAVRSVYAFYQKVPTRRGEDVPNCTWPRFWKSWESYVAKRSDTPSARWFMADAMLWRQFLAIEQRRLGIDFNTGKKREW